MSLNNEFKKELKQINDKYRLKKIKLELEND